MGALAIVLGGILVSYFSRRITEPIKELAVLSQRMANLDFEAMYTSGDHEIGVLGRNFQCNVIASGKDNLRAEKCE